MADIEHLRHENERLQVAVDLHKHNAMWSNFLLSNYRQCNQIDRETVPSSGDPCYRCGQIFHYSYTQSKLWVRLKDGTAACQNCKPLPEWLSYVVDRCENRQLSCSSTCTENTDFSSTSRWLVDLIPGSHTFYCTDN